MKVEFRDDSSFYLQAETSSDRLVLKLIASESWISGAFTKGYAHGITPIQFVNFTVDNRPDAGMPKPKTPKPETPKPQELTRGV
jgi:hypothetical protein